MQKLELYCHTNHEDAEHAIRYKIVYRLMGGYNNNNYIVTCDDFYFNFTFVLGSFEGWGACHRDL